MRGEQSKVRKSKLSDEILEELANLLKERYLTLGEILAFTESHGYKGGRESVLSLLNERGFMIAETTRYTHDIRHKQVYRTVIYKIITGEDYKKYEEEATKDAKRRLLAAVSSGSTF